MMIKMIKNYSVTLGLAVLVSLFTLMAAGGVGKEDLGRYVSVTVEEGETVADIAAEFEDAGLTKHEMIDWIEKNNPITMGELEPGNEIIIPVTKDKMMSLIAGGE